MKKLYVILGLIVCVSMIAVQSFAEQKGSKHQLIICSVLETVDCVRGGECQKGVAQDVNLPQFLKVDLANKLITGTRADGTELRTSIGHLESFSDKFVLQGSQLGKGWTMVLVKKTGKFILTVTDGEVGYIVFGAWLYA